MAKKILPISVGEVIKWLKKSRIATFTYNNDKKGCLFSRYMRHKTGLKNCIVGRGGTFYPKGSGAVSTPPIIKDVVPFHDVFWTPWEHVNTIVVSRKEAIARLEQLHSQGWGY